MSDDGDSHLTAAATTPPEAIGVLRPPILLRAWPHVLTMLEKRGLDVSEWPRSVDWRFVLQRLVPAHFQVVFRPKSAEVGVSTTTDIGGAADRNAAVIVVFFTEEKVGVKFVRTLYERMQSEAIAKAVVLAWRGATTFTLKEIAKACQGRIQIFTYAQFGYCLPTHELHRHHRRLSTDEKRVWLDELSLDESKCPPYRRSEPLYQYYDCRPGDALLFWRRNGASEPAWYLRICE